jgi:hypothetical protein
MTRNVHDFRLMRKEVLKRPERNKVETERQRAAFFNFNTMSVPVSCLHPETRKSFEVTKRGSVINPTRLLFFKANVVRIVIRPRTDGRTTKQSRFDPRQVKDSFLFPNHQNRL